MSLCICVQITDFDAEFAAAVAEAALEARNSALSSSHTGVQIPRAAALRNSRHNRALASQAEIIMDESVDHDDENALAGAVLESEEKIPVTSAGDSDDGDEEPALLQPSKADENSITYCDLFYA